MRCARSSDALEEISPIRTAGHTQTPAPPPPPVKKRSRKENKTAQHGQPTYLAVVVQHIKRHEQNLDLYVRDVNVLEFTDTNRTDTPRPQKEK
jgi:hypothetical protein